MNSSGTLLFQNPQCGAQPLLPCGSTEYSGITAPTIGPDGTIYTVTHTGLVYATNPTSGTSTLLYTVPSGSNTGIPNYPVVDANGNLYFGSANTVEYAINKSGTLLWSYPTGGQIAEAASALGPDGTLYFSSNDGYLYAISR